MSCNHPFRAFYTGLKTDKGKDLFFIDTKGADFVPVWYAEKRLSVAIPYDKRFMSLVNDTLSLTEFIPIPCGSCVGCKIAKSREWAVRCVLENEFSSKTHFITLTYSDQNLGDGLLDKRDIQLFLKRLRRFYGLPGVRYFGCGEYGSKTLRKHWHLILFNSPINDLRLVGVSANGFIRNTSDTVSKIWKNGLVEVDEFSFQAASYVARYCVKKVNSPPGFDPVLIMSRRPGIGSAWIEAHLDDIKDIPLVYGDFGSVGFSNLPRFAVNKAAIDLGDEWLQGVKELQRNAGERNQRSFLARHDFDPFKTEIGIEKDKILKGKIKTLKRLDL